MIAQSAYINHRALSLKIILTEQCNFRCATCYENLSLARMSKRVAQGIKNLITAHLPNIKYLSVDWLGGETLIATDIIYDISDHILTEISGREIHFVSGIATDGLQLRVNTFKKLLSRGVKDYQIILGGVLNKANHRINGSGAFGQIWYNLLSMKEVDEEFKMMINIPVTSENDSECRAFCELIKEEFSGDQRFGVLLKAIGNPGEINGRVYPNAIVIRSDGALTIGTVDSLDSQAVIGKIAADGNIIMNQGMPNLLTEWLDAWDESECYDFENPKISHGSASATHVNSTLLLG